MIWVIGKIGKLAVLLSMTFLLASCSMFADAEQKVMTKSQKDANHTNPKAVKSQKRNDLKLNPKSVIVKDKPKNNNFPKEIIPLIQTLVADNEQLQRSAIAPELLNTFPKGRLFQKGTVIYMDTKNWRQQNYLPSKSIGNIVGKISMPTKSSQNILITFIYKEKQWKVTFTELSPLPAKKSSS